MADRIRTSLLSLAIVFVLVFSAFHTTSASADDGAPPEQKSAEATGESSTDVSKFERKPVDPDLLAKVPDNTAVTVLDANGRVQPLATQQAAEALSTSDPVWCPGSQAPTPGTNGCTQSFTSFHDLLTFLAGNAAYSGTGTIYVQQGAYQGNDPGNVIDFNSYNLNNISNADLTVTGGWNTSNNTVDANTPSTFNNYSMLIGSSSNPWGGSVTISNLSMTLGGVSNPDVNGLTVHANDNINVSDVKVSVAPKNGAEFHSYNGDVNMRNSTFERNQVAGVVIRAPQGFVSIANSVFGNPRDDAGRRQNIGLDIENGESVSLFAIMANNNREAGVTIKAGDQVIIGSSVFSGTKDRLRPRSNPTFLGYGLQVVTEGSISIDDVTANDNFLWGAKLDTAGDINITNSEFNANSTDEPGFIDDTGLFITRGGDVSLDNVTANDNRLYGAQILVSGIVSINNSNFNNNRGIITTGGVTTYHGHGLQINTLADILIDNTHADNNMLFGGELTAGGQVTVSNSSFSNTSTNLETDVVGKGLDINSTGNTSLASVVLDNNQSVGADIQAGGDVFLDLVTATNNVTDGVVVDSSCAHVFVGNYSDNGRYGLNLGTTGLDLVSPATMINNGAGNIFPETPANCPPALNTGTSSSSSPVVVDVASAARLQGSFNLFARSSFTETMGARSSSDNASLSSTLANTRTGSSLGSLFIGRFAYVHTDRGLQVVALAPASNSVAMSASLR